MPATPIPRRLLVRATGAAALFAAAPALARSGPDSFAPLVKRVLPSVVNIAITETVIQGDDPLAMLPPELQRQFRDQLRRRRRQVTGAGSGFIIDPAGIIVTNTHVVGKADKIVVALSDGTELPAKVIGSDDLTDVAVISVAARRALPAVEWGDSQALEVGDWVLAAGNPFGLGGSVTAGIVSARGRDIQTSAFDDFIQIDAPINPGNSGGPLFNMDGRVVGVNAAILSPTGSSVGIGFAIPSEIATRIVAELRDKGHIDRGWLGISLQDLGGTGMHGVGIAAVERAGPGARAGLRPGDVITALNGDAVETARSLIRAVAAVPPGNSLKVTIQRQGREIELPVTVGRRPNSEQG